MISLKKTNYQNQKKMNHQNQKKEEEYYAASITKNPKDQEQGYSEDE